MFSIDTKIDDNGFWYLIEMDQEISYSFNYFALGSQGKFCSGEVEGHTAYSRDWQFCGVNFPILHLGITSFNFHETDSSEKMETANPENQHVTPNIAAVDISRRRMINQTVSTLLLGGAFVSSLMSSTASAHTNDLTRYSPYPPSHSPYNSPYNPPSKR